MIHDNQLRYARAIISEYDGRSPLAVWLKQYFREHKQMGSRDRKLLSSIVYAYYRLGHNSFSSVDERLHTALHLFSELSSYAAHFELKPSADFSPGNIFPWSAELSDGIDPALFSRSFLIQPDLFLRIRPGKHATVLKQLGDNAIAFEEPQPDCIALKNSSKIDGLLNINRDVVIQDRSSQSTGALLKAGEEYLCQKQVDLWDCCAASGGKSIMAHDLLNDVSITVSDKRDSIISNLRKRFSEAGITTYRSFVADLTANAVVEAGRFDMIIADVPCSGSGTWARTPEQLFFASMNKIDYYNNLQKNILNSALPAMKDNSVLVYITCSVFKKENEEVVDFLNSQGLKTIKQQVFAGYENKADTLFGALLTNSSA